jgi:hypothetical protein
MYSVPVKNMFLNPMGILRFRKVSLEPIIEIIAIITMAKRIFIKKVPKKN